MILWPVSKAYFFDLSLVYDTFNFVIYRVDKPMSNCENELLFPFVTKIISYRLYFFLHFFTAIRTGDRLTEIQLIVIVIFQLIKTFIIS